MKLLLDMGLSPQTATFLRNTGHDAVHLREQGLQRLADSDIVSKSVAERRVLLTFDLDFAHLLALQRLSMPSVVLIRLEKFVTDQLNHRLSSVLVRHQDDLERGAIVVIDPHHERVRPLPIW